MMFPRGWRSYGVGVGGRGAMTERRREDLIGWRVKKKTLKNTRPCSGTRRSSATPDLLERPWQAGRQAGRPGSGGGSLMEPRRVCRGTRLQNTLSVLKSCHFGKNCKVNEAMEMFAA